MPARRKSAQVLQLSGAMKHDPQRYAGRERELTCTAPLGNAPASLTPAERACWKEIAANAPAGLLHRRDRFVVEQAAGLLASIRAVGWANVKPAKVARYESCIARLGLSPSDGSRVSVPPPAANENPFAALDREHPNKR